MNLYRVYDAPCGTLICTVACDGDAEAALEMARCNEWVFQQLTDEAVAFECEEVME